MSSSSSTESKITAIWSSHDFILGAGVVIIQPSTGRVVLLKRKGKIKGKEETIYFLPKGRKDIGESIEECALREGYEESGYKCSLLPLDIPTHAPSPNENENENEYGGVRYPNTEPFTINTFHFNDATVQDPSHLNPNGLQYLCFWYLAQITDDAVEQHGTRTAYEKDYETMLIPFEKAIELMCFDGNEYVHWTQREVLKTAYKLHSERLRQ